jgi:hypothetical protein
MGVISNTPRPGYVWDSADNVWYPIGVGAHQHTNAADTPAVMPYSTYAAAGKNKFLNGDFSIWQRGTSFTGAGVYTADRWYYMTNGSATVSRQTFTPGTAPVSGYEGQYFMRVARDAGGVYTQVSQKIEDVRTFAGQTVTLSFWAKADSSIAITPYWNQGFGSGGSSDVGAALTDITLTTSWTRYSRTFTLPSIAGKTIGANNLLEIYTARYVGSAAVTIDIWGVQLEAGSTVTAFQTATGNPASELAACQRYYWRFTNTTVNPSYLGVGTYYSATSCYIVLQWPVQMRVAPSIATSSQTGWLTQAGSQRNSTAFGVDVASTNYADVYVTTSSHTVGIGAIVGLLGSSNHWVEASAEL